MAEVLALMQVVDDGLKRLLPQHPTTPGWFEGVQSAENAFYATCATADALGVPLDEGEMSAELTRLYIGLRELQIIRIRHLEAYHEQQLAYWKQRLAVMNNPVVQRELSKHKRVGISAPAARRGCRRWWW